MDWTVVLAIDNPNVDRVDISVGLSNDHGLTCLRPGAINRHPSGLRLAIGVITNGSNRDRQSLDSRAVYTRAIRPRETLGVRPASKATT